MPTKDVHVCPECEQPTRDCATEPDCKHCDNCSWCGRESDLTILKILISDSDVWHVEKGPDSFLICDQNRLCVAQVEYPYLDEDIPSRLEDARTMAAAPQLLDALSWALTYITDPGATEGREAIEESINAAIAAARGDS